LTSGKDWIRGSGGFVALFGDAFRRRVNSDTDNCRQYRSNRELQINSKWHELQPIAPAEINQPEMRTALLLKVEIAGSSAF
jgi:hypothetical protein